MTAKTQYISLIIPLLLSIKRPEKKRLEWPLWRRIRYNKTLDSPFDVLIRLVAPQVKLGNGRMVLVRANHLLHIASQPQDDGMRPSRHDGFTAAAKYSFLFFSSSAQS